MEWSDLRLLLAVARAGTTAGAARELGLSQPTVVRRIAAFEAALGAELFIRRPTGYQLTPLGHAVLPAAENVENAVATFNAELRPTIGILRLTAPENLVEPVLLPAARLFRAVHPDVELQIVGTDRPVDLARGEADIALRAGLRPSDPNLIARRVARSAWAVYAGRDYGGGSALPAQSASLRDHPLALAEGALAAIPAFVWLDRMAGDAQVASRSQSLSHLQAAVRAGLGVSVLPCSVADSDPALRRCFGPVAELDAEIWLIFRRELQTKPVARAMLDGIVAQVEMLRPVFEGRQK